MDNGRIDPRHPLNAPNGARTHLPAAMHHRQRDPGYPLHRIPDRPLIDHVTNEWQKNSKFHDIGDDYLEDEYGQFIVSGKPQRLWCCPFGLPRRPRRLLALYVVFLVSALCAWRYMLKPTMDHEDVLDVSMRSALTGDHKDFGTNARPQFADMTQLRHLDSKYLPGATHSGINRLVIVGDVHGCSVERKLPIRWTRKSLMAQVLELLKKVNFDQRTDHLIFTGDMIFKGPDSFGVVDLALSAGASCVRGNHEDRTLLALSSMRTNVVPVKTAEAPPSPTSKPASSAESESEQLVDGVSHGDSKHIRLALELSREQVDWLRDCPVILHLGRLSGRDYSVVHAGLAPGVDFEKQDPFQVMNMRSIDLATRVPTELRQGEPWYNVWNHYMKNMPSIQRRTAIYGHDSKTGLNIKKFSKGLDSGCVFGGRLSAFTIDSTGKEKVVSVKCKKYA